MCPCQYITWVTKVWMIKSRKYCQTYKWKNGCQHIVCKVLCDCAQKLPEIAVHILHIAKSEKHSVCWKVSWGLAWIIYNCIEVVHWPTFTLLAGCIVQATTFYSVTFQSPCYVMLPDNTQFKPEQTAKIHMTWDGYIFAVYPFIVI